MSVSSTICSAPAGGILIELLYLAKSNRLGFWEPCQLGPEVVQGRCNFLFMIGSQKSGKYDIIQYLDINRRYKPS